MANWELCRYGTRVFPGVDEAPWVFVDAGSQMLPGPGDDYIALGVGGGRFDEHPTAARGRIQGKSAALLVAEALTIKRRPLKGRPISKLPEIKALLAYVNKEDTEGGDTRFDLADIVKALNNNFPDQPEVVINTVMPLLDAIVERAKKFHYGGRKAMQRAQIIDLKLVDEGGKPLRLAAMNTDETGAKSYAFSRHGGYKAVVIQQDPAGRIQVFVNKHYQLDLNPVASAIRVAEIEAAGGACSLTEAELVAEGTNPAADRWHYFSQAGALMNGSFTAPGITPTRLTLDRVVEIVTANIRQM